MMHATGTTATGMRSASARARTTSCRNAFHTGALPDRFRPFVHPQVSPAGGTPGTARSPPRPARSALLRVEVTHLLRVQAAVGPVEQSDAAIRAGGLQFPRHLHALFLLPLAQTLLLGLELANHSARPLQLVRLVLLHDVQFCEAGQVRMKAGRTGSAPARRFVGEPSGEAEGTQAVLMTDADVVTWLTDPDNNDS